MHFDEPIKGLVAAPFTPFDHRGGLNLDVVDRQAEALAAQGVVGAFICGTTGEGSSLTTEERMALAERWVAVAGDSLRVIVHVGHNSLRDAEALASHAATIGADAIGAMPPSFIKPAGIEELVACCRSIAAAGAPLPFYYYHIPSMTGVCHSMVELLERGGETIPTLRGIKFTHNDLIEYRRCLIAAGSRFEVLWGVDEMLLAALAVGAEAAIGSTYNYAASIYTTMMEAHAARDTALAVRCTDRSLIVVDQLVRHGVIPTGKAIMALQGVDCGPPRLPLRPLTPGENQRVEAAIAPARLQCLIEAGRGSAPRAALASL